MIPLFPVSFDSKLDTMVVLTEALVFGGWLVERRMYAFLDGHWAEVPLPFYRRYAVAW